MRTAIIVFFGKAAFKNFGRSGGKVAIADRDGGRIIADIPAITKSPYRDRADRERAREFKGNRTNRVVRGAE